VSHKNLIFETDNGAEGVMQDPFGRLNKYAVQGHDTDFHKLLKAMSCTAMTLTADFMFYFEQIELQAKLLNYFLGSNKSNINQISVKQGDDYRRKMQASKWKLSQNIRNSGESYLANMFECLCLGCGVYTAILFNAGFLFHEWFRMALYTRCVA